MTASAIQGDKEKTTRAGMDDYLAKPVRGQTLERMLLKWARSGKDEGRLNRHQQDHIHDGSSCSSTEADSAPVTPAPTDHEHVQEKKEADAVSTNLPGTESVGDRGMQRVEAEDKAISLQDDKLLAASETTNHQHHHQQQYNMTTPPNGSSQHRPEHAPTALTEENMTRLGRQHGQDDSVSSPTNSIDSLHHTRHASSISVSPSAMTANRNGEAAGLAADSRSTSHLHERPHLNRQDDSGGSSSSKSSSQFRSTTQDQAAGLKGSSAAGLVDKAGEADGAGIGALAMSMRGQLTRGESEQTVTMGRSSHE